MKKIIIAIDSFKGCLTSEEAIRAATQGVRSVFPDCEIIGLPIADGGEGMLQVMLQASSGKKINLCAHNPLMELCETSYGISADGQTAFIEMAAISGLPLVPLEKRNPMLTTTYGMGELVHDALERGCRRFLVGIGGSATNDAGLGMLQALGFRFLDQRGRVLGTGGQILSQVHTVDNSCIHPALKEAHFIVACDVNSPFYGPKGAAHVFGRQKGADENMINELDKGLQHLAQIIFKKKKQDISFLPGAGAAGGLGGGMMAFLDTYLTSGIELLLKEIRFAEHIEGADLIITGEGKADRQSLMGKVPGGILKEAKKQRIPVVLISGKIEDTTLLNQVGFQKVISINPPGISMKKAMESSYSSSNIQQTVENLCKNYDTLQKKL